MRKIFSWVKHRLLHKLHHIQWYSLKKTLKNHGLALVVIVVGWEIIEDILFPILFIWLGTNVHPAFLVGAPASLLLCLHWLAVPLLWAAWIRIKGGKKDANA
jgi:hypothetical protein